MVEQLTGNHHCSMVHSIISSASNSIENPNKNFVWFTSTAAHSTTCWQNYFFCLEYDFPVDHSFMVDFLHGNLLVPASFVFGDSLVDPGNNNYNPYVSKANYAPNRIDFLPTRTPTGHFNIGRTIPDIMGMQYHFSFSATISALFSALHVNSSLNQNSTGQELGFAELHSTLSSSNYNRV